MFDHTDDYEWEDYDTRERRLKEEDDKYLKEFKNSMVKAGLSKKTIQKHMYNIEFFLHDYLIGYTDDGTMQSGLHEVDSFP